MEETNRFQIDLLGAVDLGNLQAMWRTSGNLEHKFVMASVGRILVQRVRVLHCGHTTVQRSKKCGFRDGVCIGNSSCGVFTRVGAKFVTNVVSLGPPVGCRILPLSHYF
mgnify:CR=1 FL=1